MNRNLRKFILSLGIVTVMLPLGAGACLDGGPGGDAGPGECSADTDCESDIGRCNLDLEGGTCEDDCNAEGGAVCGGDRPDCPTDGFFCVCNDTSCGDGQACNADTGLCEDVDGCVDDTGCEEDEICDVDSGDCLCETVGDERADGTVCGIDGMWEAPCTDSGCYEAPAIELCQFDDTDPAYNTCVAAEGLTGDCAAGDEAAAQSGTSPVIISIETLLDPEADACTDGTNDLEVRSFFWDVYSTVDLTAVTDIHAVLDRANSGGGTPNQFYQLAGTYDTSVVAAGAEFPDEYFITTYVCGSPSPAVIAGQVDLSGEGAGVSNAYCFDTTAAP